jgi:hypothetical protein
MPWLFLQKVSIHSKQIRDRVAVCDTCNLTRSRVGLLWTAPLDWGVEGCWEVEDWLSGCV